MDIKQATIEAVKNADKWIGGAVVVQDDDYYDAVPKAYLTDGSYIGSTHIVVDLSNGLEDSTGYSLEDGTAESIAELILKQAILN